MAVSVQLLNEDIIDYTGNQYQPEMYSMVRRLTATAFHLSHYESGNSTLRTHEGHLIQPWVGIQARTTFQMLLKAGLK